jgi:dTDP-4-dehydrorhamnose reductase
MRVLLTGARGQVGSALHPRLAQLGEVIAPDRNSLDLAVRVQIEDALARFEPELILNCAAYTQVDQAEDELERAHAINAAAPAILAEWAARHSVPLVHFSTDYVFDGSGLRPWTERDEPRPLSAYGRTKLAGESAVSGSGAPHLIVRTSWVYAAQGRNFLRAIAARALEKPELQVVSDQFGAPTSASLIADALAQIIARHRSDLPSGFARAHGVCHVAASGETSWHGFAYAIVEGLRERGVPLACRSIVPVATADYPAKAARPLNSRLSTERLAAVYGLVTPHWRAALVPVLNEYAAAIAKVQAG